jgi:peptidoglycan/LPS O-acetylase OafA/YrhL
MTASATAPARHIPARKNDGSLTRHVPALDGVRGIAILLVLGLHFYDPFEAARPLGWFSDILLRGGMGVELFFALSGFLITTILLASRGTPHYFRNFYARRALRILPLYATVLIGFFWIAIPILHHFHKEPAMSFGEQIWYWTFLQNWRMALGHNGAQLSHFWSLAIEEQFYIVWSVLVWLISGKKLIRTCIALLIATLAFRIALQLAGITSAFYMPAMVGHIDGLIMGSLLAASPRARDLAARFFWFLTPIGFVLLYTHPLPIYLEPTLRALTFGPLVARAALAGGRFLSLPFLRSFGKYSYAIYILHYLFHGLIAPFANHVMNWAGALAFLILGSAISWGMGWISWHILEEPFLRLKSRFAYSKTHDRAAAAEISATKLNPAPR